MASHFQVEIKNITRRNLNTVAVACIAGLLDFTFQEMFRYKSVLVFLGIISAINAMIFACQENPVIIFRSMPIYKDFKTNNKIPQKTGFLASFILEGTLTVSLISQNFSFTMCGALERKI